MTLESEDEIDVGYLESLFGAYGVITTLEKTKVITGFIITDESKVLLTLERINNKRI